ncbi:MAG: tetratricopeptide repeat protein [Terracidiphilus sp.]
MKPGPANAVLICIVGAGSILLMSAAAFSPFSAWVEAQSASPFAKIAIDYPVSGSIFPAEITSPTFLWRDPSELAQRWVVEVSFANHSAPIRVNVSGELMQMGENDPRAGPVIELTPQQRATRTWKPDEETWSRIKRASTKSPATISITGFAADDARTATSKGTVMISTSQDPVGAPIFYRDVPLMISPVGDKGSIQPLPPTALPLIEWKLRNIGDAQSHTVMKNLPTCANCHSFSRDGKTLGIDLDGPRNDKGLYALVSITKNATIRNEDVLRWSSFQENADARSDEPAVKRFGFMSQVSPDGRYVVTSIGPPAAKGGHENEPTGFAPGVVNRLFSMNYRDISFIQVFYPTRGILAWYDRNQKKMRPLPGADDPRYVQTSAFWSPDGKYLIFSRAEARDPYPPGAVKPEHANDPNEPQIQYDLYKIPFNGGKGGTAVPVAGASANGMSNNFPKVSPDGRWIVFVQNRNGLLMRPDSKLYIVPFAGGAARLMKCNTSLMNSWHSFSPNGRWLAFSSKARSPYTQLMLTHIDAEGNDSPAIMVENTTAANRAVNIPEFLNIVPGGLETIDPQATEFYRLFNRAYELIETNQMPEAIQAMRGALGHDPDDPLAHYGLATALSANDQEKEAMQEYRKACALNPLNASWFDHFAVSLALNGNVDEAVANWKRALSIDPSDHGAETDMGTVLFDNGHKEEGFEHLQKAVKMAPNFPDGHNHLGLALATVQRFDEAGEQLQKAIELMPASVEFRFNLGYILESRGDFAGAIAPLQKSVELSEGKNWHCLAELAKAYNKTGRSAEAVQYAQRALDLAVEDHDDQVAASLRQVLARYERAAASVQQQ